MTRKAMKTQSILLSVIPALIFAAIQILCGCQLILIAGLVLTLLLVYLWKNWKTVVIILKTLPRDLRFLSKALNGLARVKLLERSNRSFIDVFIENTKLHPHKVCFYFEDEKWTFLEVDEFSNQVANAFQAAGYRKGDVAALLMGNSATYVCMWLGLAKLGVVTALINTNLRREPLLHSIASGKAKCLIYSSEFKDAIHDVGQDLTGLDKFQYGGGVENGSKDLEVLIKECSKEPPVRKDHLGYSDPILYIYTSGTTGLPKAAIIKNSRCFVLAYAAWHILGFRPNDVMYNTLPLYHTAGGVLGVVATLLHGFPVVIRKKFSASQYWTDCIRYNCTIGLYIGEMCRYIIAQPPKPEDTQHRMRILMGNGMRAAVWRDFVDRFRIPQICELYGSTEGNTNLINIDPTVGAVGFLPQFIPRRFLPIDLIRVDDNGQPIRRPDGLCIRCKPEEPGTFVGVISKTSSSQEFAGYVGGDKENKKKVLTNVFKYGDKAFWSGDLLVTDQLGYLYFKDRLGDTFRWKGENVSAAEVEGLVSCAANNLDVTVYGVEVGDLEGRAGMATIVDPTGLLNLDELAVKIDRCLPSYARPLFIRIAQKVDITGTFKLKKTDLQREGFNPSVVNDDLYFRMGATYAPLTKELYQGLIGGSIKV